VNEDDSMSEERREYFGCPVKAFTDSDYERYEQFVEKYDDPAEGNRAYNHKYIMILANRTRRKILSCLLDHPKTIEEIASEVGIKREEVALHLQIADFLLKPENECEDGYYELNKIGEQVVRQFAPGV